MEKSVQFSLSVMSDSFATPWTVARQAPLSMGFPRQEYWSGLPFPSPGDLPDQGIEPMSSALQVDSLLSEPWVCCCVQLLSPVRLFVIPRTAARRASSSFTISRSLLKLMFIELVMPSNRLILCHPLLLLPSIFPSIRVFSECPSHHVAKVLELQLQHQSFQ